MKNMGLKDMKSALNRAEMRAITGGIYDTGRCDSTCDGNTNCPQITGRPNSYCSYLPCRLSSGIVTQKYSCQYAANI
jgi:hypothetical protein